MPLVSGPVFQICWVVEDIDASERWFTENLGVPSWFRIPDVHFGPDACTLRGEPADFQIHVSLGWAGDQQLELIQPVAGDSLYREHLDRCGEGLHHIAYAPDDFDAAVDEAKLAGIPISQHGSFTGSGISFAYLDGSAGGAPHIELIGLDDDAKAFFAHLKKESVAAAG